MDILEELDLTDSAGTAAPPASMPVITPDFDFMDQFFENHDKEDQEISSLNLSCDDEPEWCEGCKKLKKEIATLQQEYKQNILTLKQKIVPTDLLIKRFNSKCQEFDVQTKKLDELTRRLDKSQRDCTTLEAQLRSTLNESQPVKDAKQKLQKEKEELLRQCGAYCDKIKALQGTCQQLELMSGNAEDFHAESKNLQRKLRIAEDGKIRMESKIIKLKDEISGSKAEISQQNDLLQSKDDQLDQARRTIEQYSNLLKENGLFMSSEMRANVDTRIVLLVGGVRKILFKFAFSLELKKDVTTAHFNDVGTIFRMVLFPPTWFHVPAGLFMSSEMRANVDTRIVLLVGGVRKILFKFAFSLELKKDVTTAHFNDVGTIFRMVLFPPAWFHVPAGIISGQVSYVYTKKKTPDRPTRVTRSKPFKKDFVELPQPDVRLEDEAIVDFVTEAAADAVEELGEEAVAESELEEAVEAGAEEGEAVEAPEEAVEAAAMDEPEEAEAEEEDGDDDMEEVAENVGEIGELEDEEDDADTALLDHLLQDMTSAATPEPSVVPSTSGQYDADSDSDISVLSVGFTNLLQMGPALSPLPPSPVIELDEDSDVETPAKKIIGKKRLPARLKQARRQSPLAVKNSPKLIKKVTTKNAESSASAPSRKGLAFQPMNFVKGGVQTFKDSQAVMSSSTLSDDEDSKDGSTPSVSVLNNDLSLSSDDEVQPDYYCGDDSLFAETVPKNPLVAVETADRDEDSGQIDFHDLYKQLPRQSTRSFEVSQQLDELQLSRRKSLADVFRKSPKALQVECKSLRTRSPKGEQLKSPGLSVPNRKSPCLGFQPPMRRSPRFSLEPPDDSSIRKRLRSRSPLCRKEAVDERSRSPRMQLVRDEAFDKGVKEPKSPDPMLNSEAEKLDKRPVCLRGSTLKDNASVKQVTVPPAKETSVCIKDSEMPSVNKETSKSDAETVSQTMTSAKKSAKSSQDSKSDDSNGAITTEQTEIGIGRRSLRSRSSEASKIDLPVLEKKRRKSDTAVRKSEKAPAERDTGSVIENVNSESTQYFESQLQKVEKTCPKGRSEIQSSTDSAESKLTQKCVVSVEKMDVSDRFLEQALGKSEFICDEVIESMDIQSDGLVDSKASDSSEIIFVRDNDLSTEYGEKVESKKRNNSEMSDEQTLEKQKDTDHSIEILNELNNNKVDTKICLRSRRERKSSEGSWKSRRQKRSSGGFTVSVEKLDDVAANLGDEKSLGVPDSPPLRGKRPRLGKSFSEDWGGRGAGLPFSSPESPSGTPVTRGIRETASEVPEQTVPVEGNTKNELAEPEDKSGGLRLKPILDIPDIASDAFTRDKTCKTRIVPSPRGILESDRSPDFAIDVNDIFKEMHAMSDLLHERTGSSKSNQSLAEASCSGYFSLSIDSEIEEAFRNKEELPAKVEEVPLDPTCRRKSKRARPSATKSKSSEKSKVDSIDDNVQNVISPIYIPQESTSEHSDLPAFTRMNQSCVTVVSPETSGIPAGGGSVGRSESPLSISSIDSGASSPVSPLPVSPILFPELMNPISPLPPTPEPVRHSRSRENSPTDTIKSFTPDFSHIHQTPTPSLVSPLPDTPNKAPDSPVPSTSLVAAPAKFGAAAPKEALTVKPQSRKNLKPAFQSGQNATKSLNQVEKLDSIIPEIEMDTSCSVESATEKDSHVSQPTDASQTDSVCEKRKARKQKKRKMRDDSTDQARIPLPVEKRVAAEAVGSARVLNSQPPRSGPTSTKSSSKSSEPVESRPTVQNTPAEAVPHGKLREGMKHSQRSVMAVKKTLEKLQRSARSLKAQDVEKLAADLILQIPNVDCMLYVEQVVEFLEKCETDLTKVMLQKNAQRRHDPVLSDVEKRFITMVLYLRERLDGFWSPLLHTLALSILRNKAVSVLARCGMCRVFTSLCRLSANLEQVRVLVYNILMERNYNPVLPLLAIVCTWPLALEKAQSDSPFSHGITYDVIGYIVLRKCGDSEINNKPCQSISRICRWAFEKMALMDGKSLATKLIGFIQNINKRKTKRPDTVFELRKSLQLLAAWEGWQWINNCFMREMVWPTLQEWSTAPEGKGKPEDVALLLQLLGPMCLQCPPQHSDSVVDIMKTLASLLQADRLKTVPSQIQLRTLETLLLLSPFNLDLVATLTTTWSIHRQKTSQEVPAEMKKKIQLFREKFKAKLPYLSNT